MSPERLSLKPALSRESNRSGSMLALRCSIFVPISLANTNGPVWNSRSATVVGTFSLYTPERY